MVRLFINAIPTRPGGGLTVLVGLLRAWKRLEAPLEITVLAADAKTLAAVRATEAADCQWVRGLDQSGARRFFFEHYQLGRELRRRADVLLTNNHYLFRVPCPQVVHHHNVWRFITPDLGFSPPSGLGNRVRDRLARHALRKAEANIFVSDFLRRQAERFVPDRGGRYLVVRNAVDEELIALAPQVADDPQGRGANLLSVQSANPHKDNETSIRCLAELVERRPEVPWNLSIAGSDGRGSWQPLHDLARQLGVADRLNWCGYCDQAQLDALFRRSLCLLATSVLEAGPLPGIEAMARKCIAVGSNIAPRTEFVGDAGILVEPHRADLFAEAVIRLHQDREFRARLVERGMVRIREFSWSDRARQLSDLFTRLVGHQP